MEQGQWSDAGVWRLDADGDPNQTMPVAVFVVRPDLSRPRLIEQRAPRRYALPEDGTQVIVELTDGTFLRGFYRSGWMNSVGDVHQVAAIVITEYAPE